MEKNILLRISVSWHKSNEKLTDENKKAYQNLFFILFLCFAQPRCFFYSVSLTREKMRKRDRQTACIDRPFDNNNFRNEIRLKLGTAKLPEVRKRCEAYIGFQLSPFDVISFEYGMAEYTCERNERSIMISQQRIIMYTKMTSLKIPMFDFFPTFAICYLLIRGCCESTVAKRTPPSHLTNASQFAIQTINRNKYNRIWLTIFRSVPFIHSSLCV